MQYALENTNPRKSCGWDSSAPPKLLKEVAKGIAPSLTRLYNSCIELNQWPSEWKKGECTPVFKKGDRQDKLNYRPITSLICVDKIFEHLLSKQVTRHYDPTLYHKMTAYRSKHSCETTMLMLVEDWKLAVDRKELVTILSTDMIKAFDSLSHSLIINRRVATCKPGKPGLTNFSETLALFFIQFLSFRKMKVQGRQNGPSGLPENTGWLRA